MALSKCLQTMLCAGTDDQKYIAKQIVQHFRKYACECALDWVCFDVSLDVYVIEFDFSSTSSKTQSNVSQYTPISEMRIYDSSKTNLSPC